MTDDVMPAVPEEMQGTPEGQRMLRLLWDPPGPPARGPRPKLSREQVIAAAIEVAATDGLDALSMRKVATRLGVGVMSLYTYVPGKTELVELMIDHAYGDVAKADRDTGWREQVRYVAGQHLELFRRHPWILETSLWRLPMGPNVLDAEEEMYRALAAAGLSAAEVTGMKNLIVWHVHGLARGVLQEAEVSRRTGVSTEAYWESRNSFWFTYFEPERYPVMSWIYENGGFDDPLAQNFDFQIDRVLDSIQLLVDQPGREHPRPSAPLAWQCADEEPSERGDMLGG
jgi:AcrR family transcriptional regulator